MAGAPPALPHTRFSSLGCLDTWLVDLTSATELLCAIAHERGLIESSARPGDLPASRPTPREATHAALRILLAGYVGVPQAARPFLIASGGKPSLATSSGLTPQFSLAHCETLAIIAISHEGPVGIDLEVPRSIRIADDRRAKIVEVAASLCPATPLPEGSADARFLQAWTRLEALAKATGEGIGGLLERLLRGPSATRSPPAVSQIFVRDVIATCQSPCFAAVAGVGRSLAAASPSPVASALPLERTWLEAWLDGGANFGATEGRPSPQR
ncbi:MAG: 4'-phosphopantetheinyl transferase superfamily protein [Hyphomicrobiaceae bacterium]